MTDTLRRLRLLGRHTRVLSAAAVLLAGVSGAGILSAGQASADASASTLVYQAPQNLAPYAASGFNWLEDGVTITISCYTTGDTVTGKYGTENIWDMISGGQSVRLDPGSFIPDADVYTGSNQPVVPPCSSRAATAIGGGNINVYSGPGLSPTYNVDFSVPTNTKVEITCYTTSTFWVTGPYGKENIWDRLTLFPGSGGEWVPDALVYTGSNSAVVPHC